MNSPGGPVRGTGASRLLAWIVVVAILVGAVALLPPMDGVVLGACCVVLALMLLATARVPGGYGPVLLFAMTSFLFVWGRPLVSLTSRDFDLTVLEAFGGIAVSRPGVDAYLRAVTTSMVAFASVVLFVAARPRPALAAAGRDAPTTGPSSRFWIGCFAIGIAASVVQSALYAKYFLEGGSYFDLYVLGKDAVTFPGLSLLSSLLFYAYVGLLTYSELTPRARKRCAVVFAVTCLLALFRGSRGEAFAQLLVGIWLYFATARRSPSVRFWVGIVALLVCLAEAVSMLRTGVGLDERGSSVPTQLAWFVYTQGLSGELVGAAYDAFGVAPENARYLGAPLLAPLRQLTDPTFGTQTEEYGRSSGLLAHELAYRADPALYLAGRGVGSSYLAEVHSAFGLWGVLLATALIVWTLGTATARADRSPLALFVLASVLPYVLFIPRESLTFFVAPAVKSAFLLAAYRLATRRLAPRADLRSAPSPSEVSP